MRIRYTKPDGESVIFDLTEQPLTVGRSPEADVVVYDERASRVHCGIRLWDGEYYVKDLKSKNGTFVNDQQVDVTKIRGGDVIRVGSSVLLVEDENQIGANTAIAQVGDEMQAGKGYSTIMRQLVSDLPGGGAAPPVTPVVPPALDAQSLENELSESRKLGTGPIKVGVRKPARIVIRRQSPQG